jgi:hypothetical protein
MSATTPLDRVRALCLALPETSERLSHGSPTWFIGVRSLTADQPSYRLSAPKRRSRFVRSRITIGIWRSVRCWYSS